MPINRFLDKTRLTPEQIELLNVAFNQALRALHSVDRDDPICETVARKVIELVVHGMRDPQEITESVVKLLGPTVRIALRERLRLVEVGLEATSKKPKGKK
jgi:hypothetical protein